MRTTTTFKGDGIGPEIVDTVLQTLMVAKTPLAYECFEVGEVEYGRNGKLTPDAAFASFKKNYILLKAPTIAPTGEGFRSLNVTLRSKYDLYANVRPAKSDTTVETPFDHVDIVTLRRNTEDSYVGVEEQVDVDTMHAIRIITCKASTCIMWNAFAYAQANDRKKVTCICKANTLKMSGGMFLSIFQEIARDYPDTEADDKIVDNICMQLVMRPETFGVMVMPNLYGDIVSDLTGGLTGGLGLLPSSNIGTDHVMLEAVHSSAPDIAGKHIVNPTALLWSACMVLEYLQEGECAANIRKAVDTVLMEQKYLTPDLHGSSTTEEYRDAVIAGLSQLIRYVKQPYYRKTTAILLQNFIRQT